MNLGDLVGGALTISMLVAMAGVASSLEPRVRSCAVGVMPVVLSIASFGVGAFILIRSGADPYPMLIGTIDVVPGMDPLVAVAFGAGAGLLAFYFEGVLTRIWYSRHRDVELSFLHVAVAGRMESMEGVARISRTMWRFAALSILSACGEEFFYRGIMVVVGVLQPSVLLWQVVVVQAVLYGANHIAFGIPSVVGKTGFGLVLGVVALVGGVGCSLAVHLGYQVLVWNQFRRGRNEVAT